MRRFRRRFRRGFRRGAMALGLLALVSACGGGSSGSAALFVGSWTRVGSYIETCPGAMPVTTALSGDLSIVLGSSANSIVATQPGGCVANYTVVGGVATAGADQPCTTTSGSTMRVQTATSHTLTLSSDDQTIDQESMGSVVVTTNGSAQTCSWTSSGMYPKQ